MSYDPEAIYVINSFIDSIKGGNDQKFKIHHAGERYTFELFGKRNRKTQMICWRVDPIKARGLLDRIGLHQQIKGLYNKHLSGSKFATIHCEDTFGIAFYFPHKISKKLIELIESTINETNEKNTAK